MDKVLEQIKSYATALSKFATLHTLPDQWFKTPDHLAIKGADSEDFTRLVGFWRPHSFQITAVQMDQRRLATAQLNGGINIGRFGEIKWVEIMEPRPEKVGHDVVGVEHMEFYYPNFDEVRLILDDRKVAYEMQENPGHKWINIKINAGDKQKSN